jgi:cytochrome c2
MTPARAGPAGAAPRRAARLACAAPLVLAALAACAGEATGRAVPGGDPALGREALAAYGCGGCHVIPGVPGARGRVGPPLADYAARAFVAGALPNEPASLVRWIRDPQAVTPGTAMPDLGVPDPTARHMAAYLYTLDEGRLGPPHPIPERVLPAH